jgi:hypothetical protein
LIKDNWFSEWDVIANAKIGGAWSIWAAYPVSATLGICFLSYKKGYF